jgi:hypothetical protein
MSAPRRLVWCACVPLLVILGAAPRAAAQAPGSLEISEGIDDPKLERRLGTRIELAGAASPAPVPAPADAAQGVVGDVAFPTPLPRADAVATAPPPAAGPETHVPHLKIAYRWLPLAQLKPGGVPGRGPDETFHVVSLDFYPISSTWRLGLSTQYGWESGTFRANGDAFIAQSVSLGIQIPGEVFTPYFEGHAGAGFMQRLHIPELTSKASGYVQVGIDFGTEIFMARYAYLSLALGYVHGTNYFAGNDPVEGVVLSNFGVDTFSFKVGFGI